MFRQSTHLCHHHRNSLYETFPAFRAAFNEAAAAVDFDLKEVCFTDAAGVLKETQYTQPCMTAFAAGLTAVLREQGIMPVSYTHLDVYKRQGYHTVGVESIGLSATEDCDGPTGVHSNYNPCLLYTSVLAGFLWRRLWRFSAT